MFGQPSDGEWAIHPKDGGSAQAYARAVYKPAEERGELYFIWTKAGSFRLPFAPNDWLFVPVDSQELTWSGFYGWAKEKLGGPVWDRHVRLESEQGQPY